MFKINKLLKWFSGKPEVEHKGLIFAGCSFTWGQGLYYYSNLPSLKDVQENVWNPSVVTLSQVEYMKTVRYPRLVANALGTFEVCQRSNGGSNDSAIKFWTDAFESRNSEKYFSSEHNFGYFYKDFRYIIFQLTQWGRDYGVLDSSTTNFSIMQHSLEKHKISVDKFSDVAIQSTLSKVKIFLQQFENKGIKALVLTWPNDYIPYIKKDSWYEKRFVPVKYNDDTFMSIEDLTTKYKQFTIRHDTNLKITPVPMDDHPSLECHRLIASSILDKIEEFKNE